jgi:DHA1 family bicyclomycin/chloramphenicol resistance-like MFS transporter
MRDEVARGAAPWGARARLGLTLGVLSAIGPFAIDLYLPALPGMMTELSATPAQMQRTLSLFFLALAAAQIPIGSLSDRVGRKPVLFAGLAVFVVASLACAISPSVDALYASRFVQGLGICAGTILSRAMIRDLASGPEAARLMATSFLVIGVSPVLAPLFGSSLLSFMSWRGLFVVLALAGVFAFLLADRVLPESLPPEKRLARGTPIFAAYRQLLTNGNFIRAALVAGLATAVPFAYVTAAPFVLSGRFGLDGQVFSLLLGANAACSIATTQLAPSLMRRWGARQLLTRVSLAGAILSAAVAGAVLMDVLSLALFQIASMLLFALVGLALTPAAVTALDASKSGSGTSASALGTVQLAVTAAASGAISLFPAFSVMPLLVIVGISFVGAFALRGPLRGKEHA